MSWVFPQQWYGKRKMRKKSAYIVEENTPLLIGTVNTSTRDNGSLVTGIYILRYSISLSLPSFFFPPSFLPSFPKGGRREGWREACHTHLNVHIYHPFQPTHRDCTFDRWHHQNTHQTQVGRTHLGEYLVHTCLVCRCSNLHWNLV